MHKQKINAIINWYNEHKRDLPWRNTKDPYYIWLSEIILQQTRVQQGLPYYLKFIESFPDLPSLANAKESELLRLWQGLGYYSRARNLHYSAQFIRDNYKGVFPSDYNKIKELKGVGDYTAAAIASFAFDLKYPAIDGNVLRVISRIEGISEDINLSKTRKAISAIAYDMMENFEPSIFNQSMMEFGALQCKPTSPNCIQCPLNESCFAHLNKKVSDLPLKVNKTQVKNRYLDYFIIIDDNRQFYIKQRKGKGIWQNLYEFPLIENDRNNSINQLIEKFRNIHSINNSLRLIHRSNLIIHKLSHQKLHVFFNIISASIENIPPSWIRIDISSMSDFPFPEIINKYKQTISTEINKHENN